MCGHGSKGSLGTAGTHLRLFVIPSNAPPCPDGIQVLYEAIEPKVCQYVSVSACSKEGTRKQSRVRNMEELTEGASRHKKKSKSSPSERLSSGPA